MPRGTELTDLEEGHIIAFNSCGISNREIGRRLSRSESVTRRFLKKQEFYGTNKHNRGRKRKLTSRDIRRILQTANNSVGNHRQFECTNNSLRLLLYLTVVCLSIILLVPRSHITPSDKLQNILYP